MLDPNVKFARQPGFGALIRDLAEAPLAEINAKLGSNLNSTTSEDAGQSEPAPYRLIPTLLPLPAESALRTQVPDRRLRMVSDTRAAFVALEEDPQVSNDAFGDRPDMPAQAFQVNIGSAHKSDDPPGVAQQLNILRANATPPRELADNIVDPQLQKVLLSLAKAPSSAEPNQISAVRPVAFSILATLLLMAAAWAAIRIL